MLDISSENTPLWYWVTSLEFLDRGVFSYYSLGGSSVTRRIGALKAMRLIKEPLAADIGRDTFLNSWLSKNSDSQLRAAAIEYLAECGTIEDLPQIKEVYGRGEYQTQGEAINAIIRINLRDSRTSAIEALYELQPKSVSEQLVEDLFGDGATLDHEILEKGISHRSPRVRRKVVSLLAQRNELSFVTAAELLKDTDASVRFDALQAAAKGGRTFTDQEAKSILIRPIGGSAGILSYGRPTDSEGEANWARYRHLKYKAMSESELELLAASEGVYDLHAHYALHDLKFKTRASSLRAMIDDQYAQFFDDKYAALAALPGIATETLAKTKELGEYLRKGYTSEAFEIICKKTLPEDLGLVRKTLQSEFVTYSDAVVEYLRKYGEWQDIELLIKAVERPKYGSASMLLFSAEGRYRTVARAIFSMGRNRLAQLLTLKMSPILLSHIIVQSTDKSFRGLSNEAIEPLLLSESDRVRKGTALKSIRALPKGRVEALLDSYTDRDKKRYYNVIHWLDFGISVPRERAVSAVQRVLDQQWLH